MEHHPNHSRILNIPFYHNQLRPSIENEESDASSEVMDAEEHAIIDAGEEGIGLDDDGRSGKLTLSMLLSEELIQPGEKVMSIDYLGQTFKGDLLPTGKIRSIETGLLFNNPSAWAIHCKKMINPAKRSGCGWASVKYKGRKMDFFKNVWLKRKAQREAETAKNEAAQALTALSIGVLGNPAPQPAVPLQPSISPHMHSTPGEQRLYKARNLSHTHSQSKAHFVELESFSNDGKLQPFTVSVSTSAMLVLDLHSHLSVDEEISGYLGGHWDPNSHNLAITNTFPCLITDPKNISAAKAVETDIYESLYGSNLSLVGWYHSNPSGPANPSAKDCVDQLDFQIKLLGNSDTSYTPCVGLICAPYMKRAASPESSIEIYWIYPPAENSTSHEMGRPMRMSYSAVTDTCLSEKILQQVDKLISFFKHKSKKLFLLEAYTQTDIYIQKLGKSIIPKFPSDQDDRLWNYIQSQLLEGLDTAGASMITTEDIRKQTEEEAEIDDDEDTALKDEQEIDDDEETAIVVRSQAQEALLGSGLITISQFSPLTPGTHMTFTRNQDGGQDIVNLSIPETTQVVLPPGLDQIADEQPLELIKNGRVEHEEVEQDAPINFSTMVAEEDSDEEDRLVIRE